MARHLIRNAATGETRIVRDAALPFFPGWIRLDTLDDGRPPFEFPTVGEADFCYVNVTELSDPESPASTALMAAYVPIKTAAIAAGRRLRAITASNLAATNPEVAVAALVPEATASTISSPADRPVWTGSAVTSKIRVLKGKAAQAGGNSWIRPDLSVITYAPGPQDQTGLRVDTAYAGQKIDVYLRNNALGSTQRVLVDGVLVASFTDTQIAVTGAAPGAFARLGLTFPVARPRLITWESLDGYAQFYGYATESAQDVYYPATSKKGPRVLVAGDSFTEGAGATQFGYVEWLSWLMGWDDVWRSGTGSAGYLHDGSRVAFVDRYVNDVIGQNPDIVILAFGHNDYAEWSTDPASVTAAATATWDGILAALPRVELTIVGPWPDGGGVGVDPGYVAMDAALHGLALARGLRYVSPIAEGWTFTRADTTHPDDAGHELLGWRLAGHLAVPYLEAV